jgi:hypothetical protein
MALNRACLGAAQFRGFCEIAACAECQRRKIDDVVGHASCNRRIDQFVAGLHDVEISDQKAQRRVAARDRDRFRSNFHFSRGNLLLALARSPVKPEHWGAV